MELWSWIFVGLVALALAAGVIVAIYIAARRPGQPLGLRDPNRDPSANFQPQGAPQGWGRFVTTTTRDSASLEAESEEAIRAREEARARIVEAREARLAAEMLIRASRRASYGGEFGGVAVPAVHGGCSQTTAQAVAPLTTQVVNVYCGGGRGDGGSPDRKQNSPQKKGDGDNKT